MNESEQAQVISEIQAIRNGGDYPRQYYREAIDKAIGIIDFQSKNIKDLNRGGMC